MKRRRIHLLSKYGSSKREKKLFQCGGEGISPTSPAVSGVLSNTAKRLARLSNPIFKKWASTLPGTGDCCAGSTGKRHACCAVIDWSMIGPGLEATDTRLRFVVEDMPSPPENPPGRGEISQWRARGGCALSKGTWDESDFEEEDDSITHLHMSEVCYDVCLTGATRRNNIRSALGS